MGNLLNNPKSRTKQDQVKIFAQKLKSRASKTKKKIVHTIMGDINKLIFLVLIILQFPVAFLPFHLNNAFKTHN